MTLPTCDVIIVGAGPQALTVACYLLHAAPELKTSIRIIDPDGWMHRWNQQFHRLCLPILRSSCVHHPDPDPYALLHYGRRRSRSGEFHGPIGRPSTELFADFCAQLIDTHDLGDRLARSRVLSVRPDSDGATVTTTAGAEYRARHVVIATNPARPAAPEFTMGTHSDSIDLTTHPSLRGRHIAVIGGGLTAAQLALGACEREADVHLISRRPLVSRDLDVEPEWLGRALPAFHRMADPHQRASAARAARGGGSIPDETRVELQETASVRNGLGLRLWEGHRVTGIADTASGRMLQTDKARIAVSDVWLALGHSLRVENEPLLIALRQHCPIPEIDGWPVLQDDLSWGSTAIHLCGGLAALSIGPTARTMPGARMAAERICAAITGRLPHRAPQYPIPANQGK